MHNRGNLTSATSKRLGLQMLPDGPNWRIHWVKSGEGCVKVVLLRLSPRARLGKPQG